TPSSHIFVTAQLFGILISSLSGVYSDESIGKVFKENRNLKVLPCDDFYQFSCGNYLKNSIIVDEDLRIDVGTQVERKILESLKHGLENNVKYNVPGFLRKLAQYYGACNNEGRINKNSNDEFRKLTKKLGGWPVLEKTWNQNNFDWRETIYRLSENGLPHNYLLNVNFKPDVRFVNRRIIAIIETPVQISPSKLSNGWQEERVKEYYEYLIELAVALGAERSRAKEQLQHSVEFEVNIAKLRVEHNSLPEPKGLYLTLRDVQKLCPNINWIKFLKNVLSPPMTLDESTQIIITGQDFLRKYCALISQQPQQVLANYLFSKIAIILSEQLNSRVRLISHEFSNGDTEHLIDQPPPRWKRCIEMAKAQMPLAAGALFVQNYFDKNAKAAAQEIVNYIVKSFRQTLIKVTWMSPETKRKAIEKLDHMKWLIAYPDQLLNNEALDTYYDNLVLDSKSYLSSEMGLNIFNKEIEKEKLKRPMDKSDWTTAFGDVTQVNARYLTTENTFIISAGILHGNFFKATNPRYVNFAGIGSVIGHEIMHGFDLVGRQFDKDGTYNNWWDKTSENQFLEKTKCYLNHYTILASYARLGTKEIGSMDENIADVEGVRQAYLAYELWRKDHITEQPLDELKKTTPQQLFWTTYANTYCSWQWPKYNLPANTFHANNHLRVNGPISLIPQFSLDHQCKNTNYMHFERKCTIW
ncbi:hypothetical protein QAD02_010100, partial [Eretmocerus hayati]